jgi:hypothetical protein
MSKLPILSLAKTWLAALVFAVMLPIAVQADSLDSARAAGVIGELPDGYVAAVSPSPTPDVQQLVANINAQRRKVYEQLAGEKGVPVEEVGALAAEKTIGQKLQPGWYYMDNSGQWVQK